MTQAKDINKASPSTLVHDGKVEIKGKVYQIVKGEGPAPTEASGIYLVRNDRGLHYWSYWDVQTKRWFEGRFEFKRCLVARMSTNYPRTAWWGLSVRL